MQNGGGESAAPPVNVGPTKRMKWPSVRLHQPYYENPGPRKLQQQWKTIKKDLQGAKRPRTVKTVHSKDNKNNGVSDCSKGEELEDLNFDDDVAIGNWKNFNAANRDWDFKRKRVRSSSSKWVSVKSRKNEDLLIEDFPLSSGGESGEQEQKEEVVVEEKENLGANGIKGNLVIENSDPSSPNCSFDNDDGNYKLSDDNNNVGGNQRTKQRGLSTGRHSNEMGGEVRTREGDRDSNSNGVRVWLNKLGLGKYAPLFEFHAVDDEVLPFLTLEDLKDMGINAAGSRRKMYTSIQQLSKGFCEFA